MTDGLTRPENCADLRERRRVLAMLMRCGACAMCVNRDPEVLAWGRSVCKANQARAFPLCIKDGGKPVFELDEATVKGRM